MTPFIPDEPGSATGSAIAIRRRELMLGIATAGVAAAGGFGLGKALAGPPAAVTPPAAFVDMSRFVTGSAIDDTAALGRAWSQLVALDTGFARATAALSDAIHGAGLRDMAAFLASPLAKNDALIATARTITTTWYLGGTGIANPVQAKDTTGFVTYAGALMYRPTIDATVIPSYARRGTNYWIDSPAGTPTPAGTAGVRDWPTTSAPNSKKSIA
ncbi:hypothetical protein D3Y57_01455 (plasmid) [Sphingomonas paeninsulae]|uniref:Membrane bound FAD containing D-sorbitol dehydrogenase n=1 Tax=Sphingomonas paeninsulae TaxID=2319844 RepID=A0A494TH77_SPHPE|nr:sugar dehydrogenase complex small subunit [Sphingomonas paeninsulae]AYJ84788.1 hypothetical protein D3Y57_01455 [Sphingomonas paeninsulae]